MTNRTECLLDLVNVPRHPQSQQDLTSRNGPDILIELPTGWYLGGARLKS